MIKQGFTLAEVLITLAIIGVVATISIPSVISNSQQQEFKTGLRKAVSVLNSAITMNMALDGESPYDNQDLFNYLQKHMSIIKSTSRVPWWCAYCRDGSSDCRSFICADNSAFYTTDGMRFEFHGGSTKYSSYLRTYEQNSQICQTTTAAYANSSPCGGCGSYGLNSNTDNTTKPPCLIMVDVNGDRKPTPGNVNATTIETGAQVNMYKTANPDSKQLKDIFSILITDKGAIPYGMTAQKAMYESQK